MQIMGVIMTDLILGFIKIAFRNLFRHKRRSILTGISIFFGSFILLFGISFCSGVEKQLIDNMVILNTGHITISATKGKENSEFDEAYGLRKLPIRNSNEIEDILKACRGIQEYSRLINTEGMLSS